MTSASLWCKWLAASVPRNQCCSFLSSWSMGTFWITWEPSDLRRWANSHGGLRGISIQIHRRVGSHSVFSSWRSYYFKNFAKCQQNIHHHNDIIFCWYCCHYLHLLFFPWLAGYATRFPPYWPAASFPLPPGSAISLPLDLPLAFPLPLDMPLGCPLPLDMPLACTPLISLLARSHVSNNLFNLVWHYYTWHNTQYFYCCSFFLSCFCFYLVCIQANINKPNHSTLYSVKHKD